MGAPEGGWMNQQVQQREIRVPLVTRAHQEQLPKQTKFILDLVEFFGPGTVLTLIGLGALVAGRKVLGKWFGEERGR